MDAPKPTSGQIPPGQAPDDTRAAILKLMAEIAPDADLQGLTDDADLREELDIDSMDLLNVFIAIEEEVGVAVPEGDYGQVQTLGGLVAYIAARRRG
ncbi:MAG: acyl carrier protein [Candidatus Competibacterales bacterium]